MMEAHVTVTFQQNSKGGIDEQGEPDISYREPRTAAGSLIPGTPYAIDLDGTVRVWQSSKMPQAAFSE